MLLLLPFLCYNARVTKPPLNGKEVGATRLITNSAALKIKNSSFISEFCEQNCTCYNSVLSIHVTNQFCLVAMLTAIHNVYLIVTLIYFVTKDHLNHIQCIFTCFMVCLCFLVVLVTNKPNLKNLCYYIHDLLEDLPQMFVLLLLVFRSNTKWTFCTQAQKPSCAKGHSFESASV